MNLINQQSAIDKLKACAKEDRHSILISGPAGCGKSYLAHEYAKMLGIEDFQIIEPKVASVRDIIDVCTLMGTPIVLCIENIDVGVAGVSNTLLKFLEEPPSHVYIVVTSRNLAFVLDTIISRTISIQLPSVADSDLTAFIEEKSVTSIKEHTELMECVRSFSDIEAFASMDSGKIEYFLNLPEAIRSADTVLSALWRIQHFPDNSDVPTVLALRHLMHSEEKWTIPCIDALDRLESGNLPAHVILGRLVFNLRYII